MTPDDNVLYALSDTNGNICNLNRAWGVDPNFQEALADLTSDDLQVVRSSHRNAAQQSCYRKKHKGSMALLMREPGNKYDSNAVMVLMAGPSERGGFTWRHVGYLPASTAAKLAPHWFETNGIPVLLHATVAPLSVNVFNKVLMLTTEEYPDVKYRDIDYLFSGV